MQGRCKHHPGLQATIQINNTKYCQRCESGQQTAASTLTNDIVPQACFVWYRGSNTWQAIHGTGCAHWVAHQKGIKKGASIHQCLEGYTLKVPDLIKGLSVVDVSDVAAGDIWANAALSHCGMVSKITPVENDADKIEIEHSSSRQQKVAKNDFATYFGGGGQFYR